MKKFISPGNFGFLLLFLAGTTLFLRHSEGLFSGEGKVPQDFQVYTRAVERVQAGIDPYVAADELPYKYSPGILTTFFVLPQKETAAWTLYKALCLASWIAAILIGASLNSWGQVFLLVSGMVISWKGLLETLDFGQIEFVLFFCAVLATRIFNRRRFFSGLILGCLPWFKLPWGFFFLPFLLLKSTKRWTGLRNYVAGYIVSGLMLGLVLPVLAFGPTQALALTRSWISLLGTQPPGLFLGDFNQSLWTTSLRWLATAPMIGGLAGLLLLVSTAYLALKLIRQSRTQISSASALAWITPWLILGQLINPLSWRWASLLLVGVPFAAMSEGARIPKPRRVFLLWFGILLLLLLQQNPFVQILGFGHWTELHHFGSVTLLWVFSLAACITGREPRKLAQ